VITLLIALALVILVVYIFLQGWRATLIPLLAVPVSLIGTFILFPVFWFFHQYAVALRPGAGDRLVVDDAIVVVEGVERHIEEGMTPKDAALKSDGRALRPSWFGIALVLLGRIRADSVHSRNHRQALSTICRHHCDLRFAFRLQRAHSQSGAGGATAQAKERERRIAAKILRLVQTGFRSRHRGLCRLERRPV